MARKDRIVKVKKDTPNLVRLPNGRTFYARYKRTKRTNVPANVSLERVIAKSKIARNIGKKALEYLPDIYENLSGKIKNKKLKKI